MNDNKTYTLDEAHLHFAKTINGEVWELLQKPERSPADDERMLAAAFASAYHWLHAGTSVNQQRAEWLIARVHTVLGHAEAALRHAARCLELTQTFPDLMQDFDRAYAFEGLARAQALAGDLEQAKKYHQLAGESGQAIADAEDRRIFQDDLRGGDWHGLR